MKLFYYILTAILSFCSLTSVAQTVVKLPLPPQAEQALEVDVLFDEALYTGIPSAIGIMGYDISGGSAPYSYSWLEGENLLKQGETIILIPASGKNYALKVSDKKKCSVLVPIAISETNKNSSDKTDNSLWTTLLTSSSLYLKPPLDFEGEAEIILINMMGKRLLNTTIAGETEIAVSLSSGAYLLQLLTKDAQNISKHLIH